MKSRFKDDPEKWFAIANHPERKAKMSKAMKQKWQDEEFRNKIHNDEVHRKTGEGNKKNWAKPEQRKKWVDALTKPDVMERRVTSRLKTQSKEGYVSTGWKAVIAVDRATNTIVHEFKMLKEAMEWASNYLGTIIRSAHYIHNNHKDYCGFKWMYKKDYQAS